jgi:hypothetical protein
MRMGRYDCFTLKKKIRDSRTDETPRPHSCTRLFLVIVKSNARRSAAQGDKRGLDVISRDVMSSEPAAGDKSSALDTPDTDDDDDGCAEQGEGARAAGHNPEQAATRNKKPRWDGEEARNLSQQQSEERKSVMTIIRQIEATEYKEQVAKTGACSTGLEGRVGHGSGKVGEKHRFRDACEAGRVSRQGEWGGCGKGQASFARGSRHGREGAAWGGSGRGGGRRRRCEEGWRKVPAQPPKKQVQAMRRIRHLRAQPPKKRLQAMRRDEHLRAQPPKEQVQTMWRIRHLRAQTRKTQLQAMRRGGYLRAQTPK